MGAVGIGVGHDDDLLEIDLAMLNRGRSQPIA